MFRLVRETTSGSFYAREFVTVAIAWARRSEDSTTADELDRMASHAAESSVKHLLMSGAAAVSLGAGFAERALSLIRQIPRESLEAVDFLDCFHADRLPPTGAFARNFERARQSRPSAFSICWRPLGRSSLVKCAYQGAARSGLALGNS